MLLKQGKFKGLLVPMSPKGNMARANIVTTKISKNISLLY